MRHDSSFPVITQGLLLIGILFYIVFSFWESLTDTYTSTIAYTYVVSDSVDATGILLREEVVLPPATGLLDLVLGEGEQIGVGQLVGRVYQDVSTMQEQGQLEARIKEAEVLEFALSEKVDIITVTKMDEDIVTAMAQLRSAVVTGNFQNLEIQVASVQGNVLRRDYVFGSAMVAMELEERYNQVVSQIANTSQNLSGHVYNINTSQSGAYSILVDGLEDLSVEEVSAYSMAEFDALLNTELGAVEQGVGKIITGDNWYFATAVEASRVETLRVGQGITVRFSGDFAQDITMIVDQIGAEEDGKRMVILSTNRYLEQTTLLRVQSVELIYDSHTGLRVPKEAMRMVGYTDSETGETREEYGVYVLSAGYAEFKPAVILAEGNDFYVLSADSTGANALRAGNEVIVHAVGLYGGKLLEY